MSKKENKINIEISATSHDGEPETSFDLINKYGTYEIQPTSDMQNELPTIAQGLAENYNKTKCKSNENEKNEKNKKH